jgi:hypothetical protein
VTRGESGLCTCGCVKAALDDDAGTTYPAPDNNDKGPATLKTSGAVTDRR